MRHPRVTGSFVFEGRVAVITGAGSGIGRALAEALSQYGMRLALIDVNETRLVETVAALPAGASARHWLVDVGDFERVDEVATELFESIGPPHLLINSAGLMGSEEKKVWEFNNDEWRAVLATNLYGAVNWVRALLPTMRLLGEPAAVVNVASAAGVITGGRLGVYAASKHALVAYTETLQMELEAENSDVSALLVCPGPVRTNLNFSARMSGRGNSSDWLDPEDIATQVIEGLIKRRFYLFTHRSLQPRIEERFRRMVASFDELSK